MIPHYEVKIKHSDGILIREFDQAIIRFGGKRIQSGGESPIEIVRNYLNEK